MESITYLLPNYNNEKYISDCMESILNQNSTRWKCIICDDASTDKSVLLFKKYLNPNVKLIVNEKNIGCINTLIKLIENAETDIVGIVDPDDALYPEATEFVMAVYSKNKNAGFVYSKSDIFDEKLSKFIFQDGSEIKKGKTSLESGFVSHLKTFRKKYYYKTKGLDEKYLYCEDRDLVYKMEEVTELIFIDKPLYKYRLLKSSASHDLKNRSIMLRNHFKSFIEALNRRNIKGFEMFFYKMHFYSIYFSRNTNYPRFVRKISKIFRHFLNFIDRIFNIRSGGELLR